MSICSVGNVSKSISKSDKTSIQRARRNSQTIRNTKNRLKTLKYRKKMKAEFNKFLVKIKIF